MDLINDLAYPLPVAVTADLLYVPVQDHDIFRGWADKLVDFCPGVDSFILFAIFFIL